MKCIFCKSEIDEENFSREHLIPRFLGGEKVIHNVCANCNSKFGSDFENILGENEVFSFLRAYYGFEARSSGNVISPNIKLKEGNTFIRADENGHFLMFTKPNFRYSSTAIEVDQRESQENVDNMIIAKKKELESKTNAECDYKIISDIKKLETSDPEYYDLSVDALIINELFIKIAYEFTCVCLNSKYLDDNLGLLLRDTIINGEYDSFINKNPVKFHIDKRKLEFCVRKVCEVAHDNTINYHYGSPLMECSNGNYIHKISLIKKSDKFFVRINLFDIFKYEIMVSNNANDYTYYGGLILKLSNGRLDGQLVNEIDSVYIDMQSRWR